MLNEKENQFNELLSTIAEELDISEAKFLEAEKRYNAIGEWLRRDSSGLKDIDVSIYPQGSFRLGTVIRPINDKDEYDIDLVCELNYSKYNISQKDLKEKIGSELILYSKNYTMKKEPGNKRRCWTLDYADDFHIDILPSIPDSISFKSILDENNISSDWTDYAIAITDKTKSNYDQIDNNWLLSNPKGYAEWFKEQMKVSYKKNKSVLAESLKVDIEEVPEYKIKTPLQMSVQLLKRHRDLYFNGKEYKPISIIITTFAGHAYNNEENIYTALMNIINNISDINSYRRNGKYEILNPSNLTENFADKWNEDGNLPQSFQEWINKVKNDFGKFQHKNTTFELLESLKPAFGVSVVESAEKTVRSQSANIITEKKYPEVEIKNPNKPWGAL